ncbi:hypothetical protein HHK36_013975 [Tetracentron sinense]|uniref:Polygalacturonase n=1 Tax=Tetracentron sinense TaxID=13715 RepID=A0A834Z742_TETSI|nr:hypothetical protein HHK36_013975 [Tetracentron sinense]
MRKQRASSVPFIVLIYIFLCSNLTNVVGFEPLIQLPRSRGIRNRVNSKRVFYVDAFGAKGDGLNDDTLAFNDAWKVACSFSSRSRIEIPSGNTYLVGPIDFGGPCQSKVTLRVSGAIVAPKSPDVWNSLDPRKWLYFHGVNHLTVEGGGTINGMGEEWWAQSCKINITKSCHHAPTAITFHRCKKLKVRNLMIVNSQQMHMAFTKCAGVVASRLKVIAPVGSPNTDGIHISASTRVEEMIASLLSAIRQWSESETFHAGQAMVYDVRVDGAFLSNTENGLRIKTWQGGSGFARKITFQNVLMENVSNPIIIDQYYCDSLQPCPNQTLAVKVDNVSFVGIKGTSATEEAIRFACSDNFPCERIYLEDVQLLPYTGGVSRAFCWEAWGSSSGLVHPSPCFSCSGSFIKQKALSSIVQDKSLNYV